MPVPEIPHYIPPSLPPTTKLQDSTSSSNIPPALPNKVSNIWTNVVYYLSGAFAIKSVREFLWKRAITLPDEKKSAKTVALYLARFRKEGLDKAFATAVQNQKYSLAVSILLKMDPKQIENQKEACRALLENLAHIDLSQLSTDQLNTLLLSAQKDGLDIEALFSKAIEIKNYNLAQELLVLMSPEQMRNKSDDVRALFFQAKDMSILNRLTYAQFQVIMTEIPGIDINLHAQRNASLQKEFNLAVKARDFSLAQKVLLKMSPDQIREIVKNTQNWESILQNPNLETFSNFTKEQIDAFLMANNRKILTSFIDSKNEERTEFFINKMSSDLPGIEIVLSRASQLQENRVVAALLKKSSPQFLEAAFEKAVNDKKDDVAEELLLKLTPEQIKKMGGTCLAFAAKFKEGTGIYTRLNIYQFNALDSLQREQAEKMKEKGTNFKAAVKKARWQDAEKLLTELSGEQIIHQAKACEKLFQQSEIFKILQKLNEAQINALEQIGVLKEKSKEIENKFVSAVHQGNGDVAKALLIQLYPFQIRRLAEALKSLDKQLKGQGKGELALLADELNDEQFKALVDVIGTK